MFTVFKDKEYKRKFLNLMIPIALQEAIVILASTVGVFLLGAVNEDVMTGVSIANQVFFVFNSIISGLIIAGNLLSAQYYGHKDINKVNQVFNLSIKISLFISIIFITLSEVIPSQLISLFTNNNDIINYGVKYLRIFAISFVFRGISGMYFYILKNLNKVKEITIITIVTLFINIGLTALLTFAFHLNELGAAIGILTARVIETICAIYFVKKDKTAKFNIKDFLHTDSDIFNKFFKHLIPLLACKIAWSLGSIMITYFIGVISLDTVIVDDMQRANALWSIARNSVICISSGAGNAAGILIGQECGAGNLSKAKEHGNQVLKFTCLIAVLNTVIYLFVCGLCYLISLNTLNDNAKYYLIMMSLIYAPSFLFQAFNGVLLDGHYSAGGDTLFVSLSNSLPYWIIVVPLGFVSTHFHWNPFLIFFLITSEEIVKNLPIMLRYKKYKWVRNITNETK